MKLANIRRIVCIFLLISVSFILLSCNTTNLFNSNINEANPIIQIKDIEEEKEITKQINNLGDHGKGFSYYKDGWIYFSRRRFMNFGDTLDIGELYKMREDGSDITKLSNDAASNIFVKDDWIYYINDSDFRTLYKIRTDGTERTKINDEKRMFSFIYIDGWIYFEEFLNKKGRSVESPGSYQITAFSRMKLDGSDYQRILDVEIGGFYYIPPYLYAKDMSYEFEFAGGGIIRIHEKELKKERIRPNEINYEVVLEHPISGTFFVTSDNKVIHALLPFFTENNKRYIVEEDIKKSKRNKIKEVDLELFNIKNGWIYGVRSTHFNFNTDTRKHEFQVEIFRIDKNREEVLAVFTNDRNTRINIVGDWILYNAYGVKYGLSLDGKEHIRLVEPYQTIGIEKKYEAWEKISHIKNILKYLSDEGHYDGVYLNFLTIKDLEYKYNIYNFGILSEDLEFYQLENLINMTPEEIIEANIVMDEIDRLITLFEYFKSIVENKEDFAAIGNKDIDEAMEILDEIGKFLDVLYSKGYIIIDQTGKTSIDLTSIDENLLFKGIDSTSFKHMVRKDVPNQIPLEAFVVLNKKGQFINIEYLLELNPQEVIDLGIQMESLKEIKADFDFIKNVIKQHEDR